VTDRQRALLKLAVLAGGLVAAGLGLREAGAVPGTEWADRWLLGRGAAGMALLVALGAAMTAAGVPRQAVAFMAGYAFGAAQGTSLAVLATLLGAAASFLWARLVGRAWAERVLEGRYGRRLRGLRDALVASPFQATLALRLLPVGSNLALNLLAGMVGVRLLPFLAASAIGYLPQTLVFALLGKGIRVDGAAQMALAGVLLAVSLGLGLWLLRRHRAARAMSAEDPAP
jgi:uncharacterized membrane protein YdjX (TVP38/TMEM64 family)